MRLFVTALVLGAYSLAYGAPAVVCDGDECAVALKAGDLAPISGQLINEKLAIRLGQAADSFDKRLEIEMRSERDHAANERKYDQAIFDVKLKAKDADITDLTDALAKSQAPPPFYERPVFVAGATVIAIVLLYFGAVKTVELAKP